MPLFDPTIMIPTWEEKGHKWFKSFAGSGGGEPFFNSACARCFRDYFTPRGHRCIQDMANGILRVDKDSKIWLRRLCERMAHIANTESNWDFGIFGRSSWRGGMAYGIVGATFFVRFDDGFPMAYVIYDSLMEGKHVIHHIFTVPYARRKGVMTSLLTESLRTMGEDAFTVYHRGPIMDEALNLWKEKFGVDPVRYESHDYWERFTKK